MCLDIFGAWINQTKSFDWDINLENIGLFANTVFLNTKSWSWFMLGVVMNVLCFFCSWFVEINTWQVLKCTYLVLM